MFYPLLTWSWTACTEELACKHFKHTFRVAEHQYNSVTTQFHLFCGRRWYKSVLINISSLVSPFVQVLFLMLSDRKGRRKMLLISVVFGIIGPLLGGLVDNLVVLGCAMVFASTYYSIVFSLNFVMVNELLIDPYRSKTGGFKSFGFAFGGLCKFYQFLWDPGTPIKYRFFVGQNLFDFPLCTQYINNWTYKVSQEIEYQYDVVI